MPQPFCPTPFIAHGIDRLVPPFQVSAGKANRSSPAPNARRLLAQAGYEYFNEVSTPFPNKRNWGRDNSKQDTQHWRAPWTGVSKGTQVDQKSSNLFSRGFGWFGLETRCADEKVRPAWTASEPQTRRADRDRNKGTKRVAFQQRTFPGTLRTNNRI